MTDLRVCTKGVGFAVVASLSTVALTMSAHGQGGDTPFTANAIGALPFAAAGTTVNYVDNTDEICPYSGSTSPDVFYSYTGTGELVSIDLCNSQYDTKTYVLDSSLATISTINGALACNDDFCTSPNGGAFRSFLECVPANGAIFIAVDGWLGDLGTYNIAVNTQDPGECEPDPPCIIDCPAGATIEPDDCFFGDPAPNDQVNGGCNSTPPAFTSISCGEDVCGTGYMDGAFRDTDWWELDTTADAGAEFTITGEAEFASVYGRVDNQGGALDCSQVSAFAEFVVSAGCTPVNLTTARLDPGLYWFFVGPDFSEIVDCNQPAGGPPAEVGENYTLRVECSFNAPPCPWDFDGDNNVGFQDLLKVLSNWGPCPS